VDTIDEKWDKNRTVSHLTLLFGKCSPQEPTVNERLLAPTLNEATPQVSHFDASLSPFLTQLMAGLNEQIKVMASETAVAVVAQQKDRILNEFSAASQALNDLNEAREAAANITYERWLKKMEQHAERVTTTIQQSMDSSRRETIEQLRSQAAPVLAEARAALQKLVTFQDEIKVNLVTMCKQFEDFSQQGADESAAHMREKISELDKTFENSVNARMAAAQTAVLEDSTQGLLKLSQDCRQTAQNQLEFLAASAAEQTKQVLKDSSTEICRQRLNELQSCTRSHLEFISEAIAAIAKTK
jgi:hypothetical protein